MATYKARTIILKRRNFFEADRIITALAEKQGKLQFIAKGVRKSLSKNAGSIELFVICDLILAEGRNFDILVSAEIQKSFKNIRKNLSKTALVYKITELVDKSLREKQEHEDVYNLTKKVLEYLDNCRLLKDNLIFEFFALNLMADIGFAPELNVCLGCGKKILPKENFISPQEGGIFCQACGKSDRMILKIKPNEIKLLRLFLQKKINILDKLKIEEKEIIYFKKIIKSFVEYMIERELKSEKFLEKVKFF
jgi:DNA repair protein RecO (recombination protein O)